MLLIPDGDAWVAAVPFKGYRTKLYADNEDIPNFLYVRRSWPKYVREDFVLPSPTETTYDKIHIKDKEIFFTNEAGDEKPILLSDIISIETGLAQCPQNAEKLGYIGRSAFYSCYELSEIEIPNSLKYLGSGAFTNCFALESIHLPENMLFCSSDAFVGCLSLKKLVLPDCVTEIKAMSFNNTKLQEISLPATIKTIRQDAFVIGINDPLNEIHFRGTLAEWEAIEKEPSCLNFIHSFKIICTDGEKAVDKDLPE